MLQAVAFRMGVAMQGELPGPVAPNPVTGRHRVDRAERQGAARGQGEAPAMAGLSRRRFLSMVGALGAAAALGPLAGAADAAAATDPSGQLATSIAAARLDRTAFIRPLGATFLGEGAALPVK